MATKRAKVLSREHFEEAVTQAREYSQYALRDELMMMFARMCGMRAQEIARLHVEDLTDPKGNLTDLVHVTSRGAKGGKRYGCERTVPMHPELTRRLKLYLATHELKKGPLFRNRFNEPMSPNAACQQINRIFKRAGLEGCTSHSGRRSFITQAARAVGQIDNMSIIDVQRLAGHANLATTQGYVEGTEGDRKLVVVAAY